MEIEFSDILEWLLTTVGPTSILYLLAGLAIMVITDVIKGTSRGVGGKFSKLEWIKVSGAGSLIVAVCLAWWGATTYNINVFDLFESLKNTDPELATVITGVVTLVVSRWLHAVDLPFLPKLKGPEV